MLPELVEDNPTALWAIIGDILKAAAAEERGSKPGRRPAATVGSIAELQAALFPPAYSDDPFRPSVEKLLGQRSLRWLAQQLGMAQNTTLRHLDKPTVEFIERVAGALGVPPTWFPEYRCLTIGKAINELLMADQRYSLIAVRRLMGVR